MITIRHSFHRRRRRQGYLDPADRSDHDVGEDGAAVLPGRRGVENS